MPIDHTLRDYARQTGAFVAENLGDTPGAWRVDTDRSDGFHDGRVFLRGPNDALLLLTVGGRLAADRDRIKVSGYPPEATTHALPYDLRHTHHKIGMSREKGPATIALDITRRLLPDYLPYVQACHEAKAKAEADTASRNAAVEALVAAFPRSDERHENAVYTYGPDHEWYGDLRVNHDGSRVSELTLRSISTDLALKIGALLSEG